MWTIQLYRATWIDFNKTILSRTLLQAQRVALTILLSNGQKAIHIVPPSSAFLRIGEHMANPLVTSVIVECLLMDDLT